MFCHNYGAALADQSRRVWLRRRLGDHAVNPVGDVRLSLSRG